MCNASLNKEYSKIIISYCTNTTKYWRGVGLRAIFKENEFASGIDAITVLSYG